MPGGGAAFAPPRQAWREEEVHLSPIITREMKKEGFHVQLEGIERRGEG